MAISQLFFFFFILIFFSKSLSLFFTHSDALESLTKPTVHDLLPRFGFPKGLLPDAVKSYSLSDTGSFEVELERECYVHFDNLVYYGEKISGKLRYGVISDVSGIQVKKLFIWIPVTRIKVDESDGFIEFHAGIVSEKLPAKQFERIPTCQRKACGGRDDDVVLFLEE